MRLRYLIQSQKQRRADMDWTKAKNILIIALVITNIILIVTYTTKDEPHQGPDEDALIDYLNSKNIILETEIPKKQKKMAALTVEYDNLDESLLEETLQKQKPVRKPNLKNEDYVEIADTFLKKCNLMTETTTLDKVTRDDKIITVSYKNVYEDIPIDDSYIQCMIKGGKVIELKRYWLKPVHFEKMKKEPISAGSALMKFSGENTGEEIHVEEMQLVYWVDPNSFDTEAVIQDTVLPAWKIVYNDGKIAHIPAFK